MANVAVLNGRTARRDHLTASLQARWHVVRRSGAIGAEALVRRWRPDVVVMYLEPDGLTVDDVKRLRAGTDASLVAVLPTAGFLDLVDLYDAGADDCLHTLVGADRVTDAVTASLRSGGDKTPPDVDLLPIEVRIFNVLSREAVDEPATMQAVQHGVWGPGRTGEEAIVRLYVSTLRRKLAAVPDWSTRITLMFGNQYRLRP